MNTALHFSSVRMDFGTPKPLYKALDLEFRFELDAATSPDNPLGTPRFYAPPQDALTMPWARSTFLNPPYGRKLTDWVSKCCLEAELGNTIVALLPARTDTGWWQLCEGHEITYLTGRVRFVVPEHVIPAHEDLELVPGREGDVCEGDYPGKLVQLGIARIVMVPEKVVPAAAGDPAPFPSAIVVFRPRLPRRMPIPR